MRRIPSSLLFLVLVCASAILAGCTGGGNQIQAKTTPAAGEAAEGVTITSPADGAVLPAGDVTVRVKVTGFTMVPEFGQPYAPGEGHLHYYMSVGVPEMSGSSFVAPITYAATTETSYTWKDIPAGTYTFTVELANNDHSPFPRPISSSVTVRVTGQAPAVTG